jgi:hypothetical protein
MTHKTASRRLILMTFVYNIAFAGLIVAIDKLLDPSMNDWPALQTWPLVALVCAPLFLYAYELIRYIRSVDEMLARQQVQAGAIAGLVTLLAGAVAGVGEVLGVLPEINTAMALPVAAIAYSIAVAVQEARMR